MYYNNDIKTRNFLQILGGSDSYKSEHVISPGMLVLHLVGAARVATTPYSCRGLRSSKIALCLSYTLLWPLFCL